MFYSRKQVHNHLITRYKTINHDKLNPFLSLECVIEHFYTKHHKCIVQVLLTWKELGMCICSLIELCRFLAITIMYILS